MSSVWLKDRVIPKNPLYCHTRAMEKSINKIFKNSIYNSIKRRYSGINLTKEV